MNEKFRELVLEELEARRMTKKSIFKKKQTEQVISTFGKALREKGLGKFGALNTISEVLEPMTRESHRTTVDLTKII